MYGTKLCLGVSDTYVLPKEEQISLIKKAGFDAFFIGWYRGLNMCKIRNHADSVGIEIQSVHAPFGKSADMWTEGEQANEAVCELLDCIDECSKAKVDIIVCHTIIGFDKFEPNDTGIKNYKKIVEAAKSKGISIAFENTEGEVYLQKIMNEFKDYDNVGFCWDSGHEQCYNKGRDMLALYGNRLIATHLNDNLGISDFGGEITWTDDLHLLPFDGIIDWVNAVKRLNKCGYDGILTFELNKESKPNRHDNDKYNRIKIEEYIAECYNRACRIAQYKRNV